MIKESSSFKPILHRQWTFTEEQILHGLASFTYQFDGYAEYAKGWAKDGLILFLLGTDPTHEFYKWDDENEEELSDPADF